jgi:hypothetical protein
MIPMITLLTFVPVIVYLILASKKDRNAVSVMKKRK